ncbi:uncharacterized protein LOC129858597 [Salvelinus fontinalis]|uniref:uncharacterized protein LOC129858597 n=1 Tax=Salvelinus fontinalis TaxID=8038 RepID=UPI002486114F|nr:uncharacterized protein LOC129858597 [Salvelinus fontinalis]
MPMALCPKSGNCLSTLSQNSLSVCDVNLSLNVESDVIPMNWSSSAELKPLGEEPSNKESGLLMKRLSPNSTTLWYAGLERKVELLADDSFDILLPNVTAVDSGRYKCLLAAPVGEQNQQGQVHLRVTGCLYNKSTDQSESNTILVLSIVGLVAALLIFTISYVTVMNMLPPRIKKNPQEQLLDAPFEKKDFMLIYTLGPNWSGQASKKHVCV